MYQGSCLCDKAKVMVAGGIDSIIHCHCLLCRKNSGTSYATNGFIPRVSFTLTEGQHHLSTFEFQLGRIRYFCSCCGSPVYSENKDEPRRLRIRLGLLDSDINERPISHHFVSTKANWGTFNTEIPCYDGFEPSRGK